MSATPQNPIPQFAKQPQQITPKTQKTPETAKKNTPSGGYWVLAVPFLPFCF